MFQVHSNPEAWGPNGLLALVVFLIQGQLDEEIGLKSYTLRWITLNYVGLAVWVFVWMIDQTRMRGKNVWVWLLPFLLAPFPTLMILILFLQRRVKA